MFLARKITRAKWCWCPKSGLAPGEISADAVTADLRTIDNSLSFWRCGDGTDLELERAVLAIAAAGDRVDKLDLVWISDEALQMDDQSWSNTEGITPMSEMVRQHVDVQRLDYVRLGKVARCVADAVEERRFKRVSRGRVLCLLVRAVGKRQIEIDDLKERVRGEVNRSLGGAQV